LRFRSQIPKTLALLGGQPVIIHCLLALSRHPHIQEIILVVNPSNKKQVIEALSKYKIAKVRNLVLGGRERQDSVRNGLEAIDRNSGLVLIHDGVRPFVAKSLVSKLIKEAQISGAAICGVPVRDTIKTVTKHIVKHTLDRRDLWAIQTPQVFRKDLLLKAYRKFGKISFTDDSGLIEKLGVKVRILHGSDFNIKITTRKDLVLAGGIIKSGYK